MDYYLIDHDLSFQRRVGTEYDIRHLREMKTKLIHMEFIVDKILHLRQFSRGIGSVTRLSSKIPEIINKIPLSWKEGNHEYLRNVEILLTTFTESMANEHISLNKERFTSLKV